jgi:hypothetical protein
MDCTATSHNVHAHNHQFVLWTLDIAGKLLARLSTVWYIVALQSQTCVQPDVIHRIQRQ